MNHRLLVLMRETFFERIPSFCALLEYLSENGFQVDLLAPLEDGQPAPVFPNAQLRFHQVRPPMRVCGLNRRVPMTARLAWDGIAAARHYQSDYVMGAGAYGNCCAAFVSQVVGIPSIAFCVELPSPQTGDRSSPRYLQSAERAAIRMAELVITHDVDHLRFIRKATGIGAARFAILPGATRGPAGRINSQMIAERCSLGPETVIVLHSGGLGRWFDSLELVRAARHWPVQWRLVMHASMRRSGDSYRDAVMQAAAGSSICFSTDPVAREDLDAFVSSAHVGVALYSVKELGFRAELMGLASGKIGNYLKCGVPVVATDIPTLRAYLDRYKCGICVRNADEVEPAMREILANYQLYSDNAIECFNDLWESDKHCRVIAERIKCMK